MEDLVPNLSVNPIVTTFSKRTGRKCALKYYNQNCNANLRQMRDSSLSVRGTKLFNKLPKEIRNITNCNTDKFKSVLDEFLKTVPDEPTIPGLSNQTAQSNSLMDKIEFNGRRVTNLFILMGNHRKNIKSITSK